MCSARLWTIVSSEGDPVSTRCQRAVARRRASDEVPDPLPLSPSDHGLTCVCPGSFAPLVSRAGGDRRPAVSPWAADRDGRPPPPGLAQGAPRQPLPSWAQPGPLVQPRWGLPPAAPGKPGPHGRPRGKGTRVPHFMQRWASERPFAASRAHRGLEAQRPEAAPALERTTPGGCGLFAATARLAPPREPDGKIPVQTTAGDAKSHAPVVDCIPSLPCSISSYLRFSAVP